MLLLLLGRPAMVRKAETRELQQARGMWRHGDAVSGEVSEAGTGARGGRHRPERRQHVGVVSSAATDLAGEQDLNGSSSRRRSCMRP